MRIDVTTILMSLSGEKPIEGLDGDIRPEPEETNVQYAERASIDLTFRKISVEILLAQEEKQTGENKLKRFVLAERIQLKNIVTFTNEDIKLLQKASEEHSNTLVHGRMVELLDPEEYKKLHVEPEDSEEKPEEKKKDWKNERTTKGKVVKP